MKNVYFALALACITTGCAGSIVGMNPTLGAASIAPDDASAVVVFVRHSRLGKKISFPIVTEDGQFVANLRGQMHAFVTVPAGHHRFFVIAENAELVELDAMPGRTYVVETRPRMGWGKARVTVEGVRRGTERFTEALEWIRETPAFVPEPVSGANWAAAHRGDILEKIAGALEAWTEGDDAYHQTRTLGAEDGYLPNESAW